MVTLIGVDLAWRSQKNHTGVIAFRGGKAGATFLDIEEDVHDLDGVVDFIKRCRTENTVVAVDAPLIIRNQTGRRPCEAAITERFGAAHAGCHPSNLTLYPSPGGVELAARLEREGFSHIPSARSKWRRGGCWFFEVYPHPAHVVLFGRRQIIKYKKGPVASRRLGLEEFRREIKQRILRARQSLRPSDHLCALSDLDLKSLRGRQLKSYEDTLDAILCAYLAFHLWRWGWQRSELVGNLESGYIVVPTVALNDAAT